MRLSFKEMKDAITKIVPKDIQYDVDLEAETSPLLLQPQMRSVEEMD